MEKINVNIRDSIAKLSKGSRVKLINEIKKNLNLNSSRLFMNNSNNLDPDSALQVENFLSENLKGESFLVRIWIYILKFFQKDVSKKDIYKNYYLKSLENSINNIYKKPVIDFRKRILHMGFVEMFFGLYRYSMKLKKFFQILDDRNAVERAIFEVINRKIPDVKHKMEDFLDSEEYEKYLKKDKSKNDLECIIKSRINTYINSIPLQTYKTVEDIFKFFYILNSIAFFPYKSFFSFFDIEFLDNNENLDIINFNNLVNVSFDSVDKYFNSFFDILYTLRDIEVNEEILKIIIRYYFLKIDSSEDEILGDENILEFDIMYKNILSAMSDIISLSKTLPYMKVFKLYYKNPVLQPKKYVSYLDLKSFYENILFLNVSGQIISRQDDDLKSLMNKEIKSLIKNYNIIVNLNNIIFIGLKIEYSNFKKIYFMNEFFRTIYDTRIMEVLKIIANVVLVNNIELRSAYISLEKNFNLMRKEIYDFCFEINYKNEEYERCNQEDNGNSCREKILEWCLNENCYIEKLVLNFIDCFIELRKRYCFLLENNNTFIQSALNISYKLSTGDGDSESINLAYVINNILSIIDQTLFILESL
ncbi:hypothetical protein F0310_03495 [Borrelia sp. A-FGy1]|uniref:hypothetical protein n=1 Tax=Borrelia sp. A-FGy1 TaxID=2608247 RepID=UPI0015F5B1EC|nr:hypothetical protein [Borrelia sp. A-FGy1]QMU99456.1 hypothetical protein F0310_03495 [Borrelia sp. A-FGy1]